MAGFQSPITIAQAIEKIKNNEYLLPAFQREFVWKPEQIENLFNSIMKGYPISSMLFWKVKERTKSDFKFYKFLDKYREWYRVHNDVIQTDGLNDFWAVLDGQQRLTALYIGLCGSYAYKEYRKNWADTENALPTRSLYLNITNTKNEETQEIDYNFSFLKNEDTKRNDIYIHNDEKWFRVGRIMSLHIDEYDLDDFSEDNSISREEKKVLKELEKKIFNNSIINYYEEDEQRADKAVNVFIRINSGGTHLSFSDILMSVAVANWKQKDARTEIHNLVDSIREKGFNINKDYVLKAFLFLHHKDIRFKIDSFNNDFITTIESEWGNISEAIIKVFELMSSFGFNDYTLTAKNATLPILYYIYHKGIYSNIVDGVGYKNDRSIIKKWLHSALLKRIFGSQADNILAQIRKGFTQDIEKQKIDLSLIEFPSFEINKELKNSEVTEEFIEDLLLTQKDDRYCFSILALLYPNLDYKNNDFHKDHLHPASKYDSLLEDDKIKYGWEVYNSILNLQMLDANENESKNNKDLEEWVRKETLNKDYNQFLDSHLIPNTNLSIDGFSVFIEKRREILINKLKKLFN